MGDDWGDLPEDEGRAAIDAAIDEGVTFAGVPLEPGVAAVEELRRAVPEELTLAQFVLRWILDFDAVSTVIPGSTAPDHIAENVAADRADPLSHERHGAVRDVYEERIAPHVHQQW